jgi:hypothetical protein
LRLYGFFKLREPNRQPVSIRAILIPPGRLDHLPDNALEAEFEKRAIMDFEQAVSDMDARIRFPPARSLRTIGSSAGLPTLVARERSEPWLCAAAVSSPRPK